MKSDFQKRVRQLTSISARLSTYSPPAKRQRTQLPPVPKLPLAATIPAALTFLETSVTFQERTITDPYQDNKQFLEQSFNNDLFRNLVVKILNWKGINNLET
jgi:hypothetical protein